MRNVRVFLLKWDIICIKNKIGISEKPTDKEQLITNKSKNKYSFICKKHRILEFFKINFECNLISFSLFNSICYVKIKIIFGYN